MIVHPRIGQSVQVWYRASMAAIMPHHARVGHVAVASKGPGPRNHGVMIEGRSVVVPCGNLRKPGGGK